MSVCFQTWEDLVISSAWRSNLTVSQFNEVFDGRVIGCNPFIADLEPGKLIVPEARYKEILAFLEHKPELQHLPWLAFDDQAKLSA